MSIRGRAFSRVTVWFAIGAVTVVGLAVVQATSPSLMDSPVERHNLFDAELLVHDEPTALTVTYSTANDTFSGQLTTGPECLEGRTVTVFEDPDGIGSAADIVRATGTTSATGAYTTSTYEDPAGPNQYYAVADESTYDTSVPTTQTHTCLEGVSNPLVVN